MKALALVLTLSAAALAQGGGEDRARALYNEGRHAESMAAWQELVAREGDRPHLLANLALSALKAGELEEAQSAIDRYAAVAGDAVRKDLHQGMLGNLRYAESLAAEQAQQSPTGNPLEPLEQAIARAEAARTHFLEAASAPDAAPEVKRNLERTLRRVAELRKKLEEAKDKQEKKQSGKDQQENPKEGENKPDGEKQDPEQKQEEGKPSEPEQKQDPKDPNKPEPQKTEDKGQQAGEETQQDQAKPQPAGEQPQGQPPAAAQPQPPQRSDAPGEQPADLKLSPEERQRMYAELDRLEKLLKEYRARTARQRSGGRDW